MAAVISRADRVLMGVFAGIAAVIGALTVIRAAFRLRLYLLASADGNTPVSLLADASVSDGPTDGEPRIVAGIHPTADLLVDGLDGPTRLLLGVGEGLGALVAVVVAGALAWLFLSLGRGRPFARSLHVLALVAGATLALGSLLAQGIAGFGRMEAAAALNDAGGSFRVGFPFDPMPIVVGFAIMTLALVFRAGTRLQRDTDGLV